MEQFFFRRTGEDVDLRSGSLVTRRGFRILQELIGSSECEDVERRLEDFCHPVISPGGNRLLCSAGLPSLEENFHLLHCTETTFIRPGHSDTITASLLTASQREVGTSFELQQFGLTDQCRFVTVRQSLAANLVVDIEVLNLTEGVICLEKHRNIGAATATTKTGIPESCKKDKLPRCETLRDSSPAGGVSSHQITVNYSHSCPPEAAVSFGNVKETKEPGKSTFSDGETDGESSARIYPSKLTEKKEKAGKYFSMTCCGEQTVYTQPFNIKQAKNTSVNSEPARVENISPPLTTTRPSEDNNFSMGSINFQPVGLEETPSDLSDLDNTDQNNEDIFPEFSNEEKISPNMGTINLESVDAYDETLDSDYEEPEVDCPDKSKSPDRSESKREELWGRNKYSAHYKLYHGGEKVSVKLRKCSVSLARLSRKQSNTRKRLKRREVWMIGPAAASSSRQSVKTYKWKTNDPSLSASSSSSREPPGRGERARKPSVGGGESPGGQSDSEAWPGPGRVRTLLDPLQPLVAQIKRLHLLLADCQPALSELGLPFPVVVSAPHLAHVLAAFLRFHQVPLRHLDQNKTRSAHWTD